MNFIAKYKDRIILYLFVALTASFLLSIALMQIILGMILIFWLFEKDKFKSLDTFSLLFVVYVLFRVISVFTSPYLDLSITTLYKEVMFYVSFYAFM